jgi:hypothetical protein
VGTPWLYGRPAWLHGCLAAWLLGCLAAWLLGCLAAWLLGSLAPWLLARKEPQNVTTVRIPRTAALFDPF